MKKLRNAQFSQSVLGRGPAQLVFSFLLPFLIAPHKRCVGKKKEEGGREENFRLCRSGLARLGLPRGELRGVPLGERRARRRLQESVRKEPPKFPPESERDRVSLYYSPVGLPAFFCSEVAESEPLGETVFETVKIIHTGKA